MLKSEVGGSECSTSENPPKRIKMESRSGSGTSTSASPEGKKLQLQEDLIDTATHHFAVIRNKLGFVDHTLFIRNFLSNKGRRVGIFAPRRFGKSTQLNMLKLFLSCVDKSTRQPYANMDGPPEERKIYQLFKDTKIVTDGNCEDILTEHLGKHPVIHLHLKTGDPILSVQDARDRVRIAVSDAYKEHSYLIDSLKLHRNSKLNAYAQLTCENWCSPKYKDEDLVDGLKYLAEYLFNHFDGTKVYLLVDEFDAINANALQCIGTDLNDAEGEQNETTVKKPPKVDKVSHMKNVASVVVSSICELVKEELDYVGGVMITGVSYLSGFGFSDVLNNLTKLRFLDRSSVLPPGEAFVPFYGATEVEVENLVEKLVRDDKLVNCKENKNFLNEQHTLDVEKIMLDLKLLYNGYLDEEDTPIFCLWSVLQYLQTGKPKHFWNETDSLGLFFNLNIFQNKEIAKDVLKLMNGKTIAFNRLTKIDIKNLLQLQGFNDNETIEVDYRTFFTFLIDQGYLSYTDKKEKDEVKMPNPEIRAAFFEKLEVIFKILDRYIKPCAETINTLSIQYKDTKTLQEYMLIIYKNLSVILQHFENKNSALINETMIMCALYHTMNQATSFDFAIDSCINLDGETVSKGRPDYFQRHKSEKKFCIIWELKYNKTEKEGIEPKNDQTRKKLTSKYALQEARGKEYTTHGTKKDCLKVIEKAKLDALVIGLSLNGNYKTSLSYAWNDEEEIFCITENEKNLYPDYYTGCTMLRVE